MGFLDKAKEAANQAMASAQQAAQQGQAKLGEMQQGRVESDLLKTLGDAFYNEQRRGGDRQATIDALVAVDNYHASQAAQAAQTAQPGAATTPSAPAPATPSAYTPPPPPVTAGGYTPPPPPVTAGGYTPPSSVTPPPQ